MTIYLITNTANGMMYVGMTKRTLRAARRRYLEQQAQSLVSGVS